MTPYAVLKKISYCHHRETSNFENSFVKQQDLCARNQLQIELSRSSALWTLMVGLLKCGLHPSRYVREPIKYYFADFVS